MVLRRPARGGGATRLVVLTTERHRAAIDPGAPVPSPRPFSVSPSDMLTDRDVRGVDNTLFGEGNVG